MRKIALIAITSLLLANYCLSQQASEPQSSDVTKPMSKVYKTTKDSKGKKVDLKIKIFLPDGHKASDQKPAIVFFFGGGWRSGSPDQFDKHCEYLAKRGMVAMTADYRVLSRQGTKAIACVEDAKSAVRWIRKNSKQLGVDPEKIAAGGGSAGGHVAAATGTIKKFDSPEENSDVSSVPNALVLFNPALVLAPIEGAEASRQKFDERRLTELEKRMGTKPVNLSPIHHVAKGVPPTIIFHGKADKTVPYWTAEKFSEAMKEKSNRCELKGYADQGHGFFNAKRKNGKYKETVQQMDQFLVSLGFLKEK